MNMVSRRSIVIIGASAGAVGIGAIALFMMSRGAKAETYTPPTLADCPEVDNSSKMANVGGKEGAKWQQGFYQKSTKYRGVNIYKIVKTYVPVPGVGAFADIGPCKDCGYAAFITMPAASTGTLEDIKRYIDDACPGGLGAHGEEIRWYEQHPQMPKPCDPWPGCLDTKTAPSLYRKTLGHAPPCECANCGC